MSKLKELARLFRVAGPPPGAVAKTSDPSRPSANVFICYAPEDGEFVMDLDGALKKRRRVSSISLVDGPSGAPSPEAAFSQIASADTFLFVVSPDSAASQTCRGQLAYAAKLGKRVVPILRREVGAASMPAPLAGLDLINYREQDEVGAAFQSVLAAVETNLSVDVFICYSRKDAAVVNRLYGTLSERGRSSWIDLKSIPFTGVWEQEIYAGIEAANNFVFVLSPDSLASEFCIKELNHALKHNKRLIPILARPVDDAKVPPPVAELQRIPFLREEEFERDFEDLLKAIDTDLNYVHEHTRLLTRARDWERRGHNDSLLLFGKDLADAERLVQLNKDRDPKPTSLQLQYIITSRQSASRSQRFRLAAVTTALVVAVGLALLAYQQSLAAESGRRTAESERQKADEQRGIADTQRDIAVAERAKAEEATALQKQAAYDAEVAKNDAVAARDDAVKAAEREKLAREQAEQARNEAQRNLIRSQAKTAAVESLRNVESDPGASVAFATRSLELYPSEEARALLANALLNLPAFSSFAAHVSPFKKDEVRFSNVQASVGGMQFTEGGKYIVVTQKSGSVEVRDASTGATALRLDGARADAPPSADEAHRTFSFVMNDGSLKVFSLQQGVGAPMELPGKYALAALSSDGEQVVTVDAKGEVGVISLRSKAYASVGNVSSPLGLGVNRGATRAATLDAEGNVVVRALPSGAVLASFKTDLAKNLPDLRSEYALLLNLIGGGENDSSRGPRDPNKRPIPSLFVIDRITDLISKYTAQDPELAAKLESGVKESEKHDRNRGEAIVMGGSSLDDVEKLIPEITGRILGKRFAPDCQPQIRFGPDDDSLFLTCRTEALMLTELWDTRGTPKKVSGWGGLFGAFDMSDAGDLVAVAGVDTIFTYAVGRGGGGQGPLLAEPGDAWQIAYADSRIGPPRELRLSPRGGLLLTLHAPFVQLQGTPPATVSLWYTRPVDARDGNEHQGVKLRPHRTLATTAAFSPEADKLATYTVDGTVRVWRVSSDRELFDEHGKLTERAVASLFRGYKYLPAETWDALDPLFPSDDALLDAVRRVTRQSLTAEELRRFGITAARGTPKGARSAQSRPASPLKELISRQGQIAVQN